MTTDDLTTDSFLTAFVRDVTGNPAASPREGQQSAYTQMTLALDNRGQFLACLPTGSGKSACALAAAASRAFFYGERTIISTESLSLMTQITQKDGPAMQRAYRALGAGELLIAAHKGVSNYLDPRKLFDTANTLAGISGSWDIDSLSERVREASTLPSDLDGEGIHLRRLRALVLWGLDQYADDEEAGDRHEYHGDHTSQEWTLVAASSSAQAATEKDTPYMPKVVLARMRAAAADVVITNHTLLGIQAAQSLPVVNGSKAIGSFENLIVDEAHALPAEVRARGAADVSGRSIHSLIRAVSKLADGAQVTAWANDGERLADRLEQIVHGRLKRGEKVLRLNDGDNPLSDIGEHLTAWLRRSTGLLKAAAKSPVTKTMLAAFRAAERAEELDAAINQVSEHRSGQARWIQADDRPSGVRWTSVQASLVDVSGKIAGNLWSTTGEDGETVPVGVVCMSATLPANFQFELGAAAPVVSFPSPFTEAYARSMLYIPAITQASSARDVPALTSDRYGPRKFDTAKHTDWAAAQIVDLVRANDGSALILAATASSGRTYVEVLRKHLPHLTVLSQWDGATPASLVAQWREDHDSVLVGTRSYMTGVDGPGNTCTLLVLDRIPRSPSNPLDDARVEAIMGRLQCDKWAADRFVYAADAALLEQQAVGRLIRCFDLDTEILTTEGWKRYDEVEPGMTVFGVAPADLERNGRKTFNPSVHGAPTLRPNKVRAVKVNDIPEPVMSISGKSLNAVVTPDHTMLYQATKKSTYKGDGFTQKYVWKSPDYRKSRADDLPARFRIPLAGRIKRDGARSGTRLGHDWYLLMGLVISDGHISKSKSTVSLHQSTSKTEVVQEIDATLSRLGIAHNRYVGPRTDSEMTVDGVTSYRRNGDLVTWQINGADAARIRDVLSRGGRRRYSTGLAYRQRTHLGWDKETQSKYQVDGWKDVERRIPNWVFERASRMQILALIRGLMLGDGNLAYVTEGRDSGCFYTKEREDADRFQALCALVGYRSSVSRRPDGQHAVAFSHRGDVEIVRESSVREAEDARTWCVNTELGSVLVRRNGKTFIAGNSAADSGLCAVLDPRLVRSKAGLDVGIGYPEATRQVYAAPLRAFTNVVVDRDQALAWMAAHREQTRALVSA